MTGEKIRCAQKPKKKLQIFVPRLHNGVMVMLCLAALGFSSFLLKSDCDQEEKIDRLQPMLQELQATVQIDSVRRYNVQKVATIIDRFNPEMNSELKFKIAVEVYEMSCKYADLDLELICATITHESARSWNPEVISPVGALGLMQIMPTTGIYLAREEGINWTSAEDILFDPIYNIRLGCRYLSKLVRAYGIDGGLAAYNGGEWRAERWLAAGRAKGILHVETAFYVPSILKLYEEYQRMSII